MQVKYEPLGNCLEWITYGFTKPMPDTDEGPWKITAKDINGGKINYGTARKTDREQFDNLTDKCKPKVGDVLLTKDGTLGRIAIVDREDICINQSVALLRSNEKMIPEFMAYLLQAPEYQRKMEADSDGTTIKHIYITRVDKMFIPVPEIVVQKRIVDILKAFDGKIDNNNQINRNLLEQAITVFKEKIWFKDKNGTIGDYCIMKSGFAFKSSWWTDEGVKVIKIGDINQDNLNLATCSHVDEDKVEKAGDFSVKAGDLVLAMTGATIGKFAMVPERSETILVNQRVGKFFLGEEPLKKVPFIYCTLKMDDVYSEVIGRGQGSAQPNISGNDVMSIPCVIPTGTEIDEFNEFAEPIFASIVKNQNENEKLANVRDSLLPKLMSGELDVSELEI